MMATVEQRQQKRVPLICPVRLRRAGSDESIQTATRDISSTGFFCHVREPVSVGEIFNCEINLPLKGFAFSGDELWVRCTAVIVRVVAEEDGFGIGCRFDYFSAATESVAWIVPSADDDHSN